MALWVSCGRPAPPTPKACTPYEPLRRSAGTPCLYPQWDGDGILLLIPYPHPFLPVCRGEGLVRPEELAVVLWEGEDQSRWKTRLNTLTRGAVSFTTHMISGPAKTVKQIGFPLMLSPSSEGRYGPKQAPSYMHACPLMPVCRGLGQPCEREPKETLLTGTRRTCLLAGALATRGRKCPFGTWGVGVGKCR